MSEFSGDDNADRLDVDRLIDIMTCVQRGARIELDPRWLKGRTPLSESERRQLKGIFANNRKQDPAAICMAPTLPACANPPIDSHSMQRGGPLSVLAEGHRVLVLRYAQSIVEPADPYMDLTPIRKATVFPGLCVQHDTSLFEPIERHSLLKPTPQQSFLLAYRATLRAFYVARKMASQREADLVAMLDRPPNGTLEIFVASLLSIEIILPQLSNLVREFGRWHRDGTHELPTIVGRNLPRLPFAVSSYIEPRFDEDGRPIQYDGTLRPFFVLNVVPQADGSTVTISFLEEHRQALHSLLAPLKASTEWRDFADRIWQIALRYSDNLVVAPTAWRGISKDRQKQILDFADDTRDGRFIPMFPSIISLFESP